jgi:hypothetical protein
MLTIDTWNAAAEHKSEIIYGAIKDHPVLVSHVRFAFERLSGTYFNDTSLEAKERVHELWKEIGAKALKWGEINDIRITPEELVATLCRKQRDYGHHNIAKYGREGLIIRVHDKISRLENLTKGSTIVSAQNEPISDTILDIAGYSAIGMMWEHDLFLLPLV